MNKEHMMLHFRRTDIYIHYKVINSIEKDYINAFENMVAEKVFGFQMNNNWMKVSIKSNYRWKANIMVTGCKTYFFKKLISFK